MAASAAEGNLSDAQEFSRSLLEALRHPKPSSTNLISSLS
jgi:hypothetical protein